ncbi:MAG: ChaN family lipoprotein [Rhodospirillaceae bacterium]|nr:ChaN family lipoprotein [Rhodospirillaceae bacterium]
MSTRRAFAAIALAFGLAACAGGPQTAGPSRTAETPVPVDLTEFALVRTDGGARAPKAVSVDEAADVLKDYDVIFLGEMHRHPGNHLAQMRLFRALHERVPDLSLSMEQFERDVQDVVDEYLAGAIGEEPFRKRARAWDNYPVSYRPLVEYAKTHRLPVIAAEAPNMVIRCVGQEGPEFLNRMKPEQRGWAAARLDLRDGPYKDKFMRFAAADGGHGEEKSAGDSAPKGPSAAALRSFAAQVTRDDTMAESIFLHRVKNPGRTVVHLNGSFHSESFLGTAERLAARDPSLRIAVVNPIAARLGQGTVTAEDAKTGTFVLLIAPPPKGYASMDEMKAAIAEQMKFRDQNKCEL